MRQANGGAPVWNDAFYVFKSMKNPTLSPIVLEARSTWQRSSPIVWLGNDPGTGAVELVHAGKTNVGFADGHAKSLNKGEVKEKLEAEIVCNGDFFFFFLQVLAVVKKRCGPGNSRNRFLGSTASLIPGIREARLIE